VVVFVWGRKLPASITHCLLEKTIKYGYGPGKIRHFTPNHSHLLKEKNDYFQRLLDSQNKQRKVSEKKVTVSEKAQEASYLVAELIAPKMKSHTIAENLIMRQRG
jgi:hypothetical protein